MHAGAWIEPAAGVLLMLLALLDIFLTVLYARAGAGFISDHVARSTWAFFHWFSKAFGRRRSLVLSLTGSFVVVWLVVVWAGILTLGSALILHPYLGTSVRGSDSTQTDFFTALYAGGSSMSLVGSSDYSAKTTPLRMVYLFNSLVGMSVMSLALTYVMQIYSALQSRNTFGLMLHQMSGGTGDAAVLVGGVGPRNEFSAGYSNLGEMADSISAIREAHDFYPVLFYFRFPEARYSASRTTLLALDAVSLIRASIPDGENAWIKESASVRQLWESAMSLLKTLQDTFLPGEAPAHSEEPGPDEREQWMRRYRKAIATLRDAGIDTVADEREGAARYIEMRKCWNRDIVNLASYMAWRMDEIDRAMAEQPGAAS
jgi:hypothetical protein